MRQHHPEPPKRCRGDLDPERWNIPLEKSFDVIAAPAPAIGFRLGQIRKRKAAPDPQSLDIIGLCQSEGKDFHKSDSSGERFSTLPDQIP
jgi:hypothetical protein